MKKPSMRALSAALSLAFACGFAAAADTPGSSTASTGSSVTGGQSAPAAQPATGTRNSSQKGSQLARADRKFMQDAAEDGMAEVQIGQLAANKAGSDDVKQFASKVVEDHQSANNELIQLANTKGLELPAAPTRSKRREIEKLGKESGAKFDQQFAKEQVKDHEKDIKNFEKASGKVKDPQLKAWIDKTLPHLREHLAMAQKLPGAGGKNDAAAMGNRGASTSDMATTPGGAATGTNTGKKTGS